jgi:hypothetical protein
MLQKDRDIDEDVTIESKLDGGSGAKLLAFFVTRECHKS